MAEPLHEIQNGILDDVDLDNVGKKKSKDNKRLSVERIYQKKSQLEHILLRPDSYIGSVEKLTQLMWVFDNEAKCMVNREITYVPGLYKIFDEILVNAADNKQRDAKMDCIKIDIDKAGNKIKIWNNGKGIPIVMHQEEKVFVPTLIFGHLLTSSNYDDSEKKVVGGRNGYGAKLCNIFSTKFILETQSNEYKKAFRQSWNDNMTTAGEPKTLASKGDDYTCVTFHPDLKRFKMEELEQDTIDLFCRRAYDIAASSKGVKVFLNGDRVPIKNFKDYIDLYVKDKVDDNGEPIKCVHEIVNDRWEIGCALSEKGFQQISFVNSIATTKGGAHVNYIADQLANKLSDAVKKKEKKGSAFTIKPFQIKNHMWVFVNCLIENPTFDSQTKENMTLVQKSFGSTCAPTEKFANSLAKVGLIEAISSWMKYKAQEKMNKKCGATKQSKLKGIPKLDDANNAGTKGSENCTLILTEGDSAKTLAVAGLGVIGRDNYGVFPLRGKLLNVREASSKQILENAEINAIIKIIGLRYKEKYDTPESLKTLRYGKVMIMTDQDQDGSHIKGLVINFIHTNWPGLLRQTFVEEFITPIVKVSKKNQQTKSFYSLPEFEEWKSATDNWHTYKVKYYKGLGTSTSLEAKEYFSDMVKHRIPFRYEGAGDDQSILLAFSKKKIEERKEWLTNWMEDRKRRTQLGLPEVYLYDKDTRNISYDEFINKELILFSNMDNERSIPGLVDGFKPGQRKVLFACFKRKLYKEMKVAQLAGSVAELSAYHHGETSLMGTIVGMAQNYVGSNNINVLLPIGQFGTRLHGGKDSASPRYIFTQLSSLCKHLFNPNDEPVLKHLYDDGQRIEPEYYCPIIPMVLVNGTEGIGTGWSTKIPNYDPREIVKNIKRMIDGLEPTEMQPWYKHFTGTCEVVDSTKIVTNGEVAVLDDDTIEITELPVKTWTQNYKENLLESLLTGTDKIPALIEDYKEYHTDATVRFVVKMNSAKLANAEETGLHKVFKLQAPMSLNSMVLFDANGCIKRYSSPIEILKEFFEVRKDLYEKRKAYLEGMMSAESLKLDNQARFIMEKIEGTIVIENKPKKQLIQLLVQRGYDSDPVKSWKISQDKLAAVEEDDDDASSVASEEDSGPDFNYILGMALWCLTKEKKDELLKNRDLKADELYELKRKTPDDLWINDLNEFLKELDIVEEQERKDANFDITQNVKTVKGRKQVKKISTEDTKPSVDGRRIIPVIDPAYQAKAELAMKQKNKKLAKLEKAMSVDDDDTSEMPTADQKEKVEKVKKEKKPRVKKEKNSETSSAFDEKPKKGRNSSGNKKGKKVNPWSDNSEEEISGFSNDDDDEDVISKLDVEPRSKTAPRRQAVAKSKYTFSDDEESEGFKDTDDEDNISDYDEQKSSEPITKNEAMDIEDDDSKSSGASAPKEPVKPSKRKNSDISDDSDDDKPSKPKKSAPSKMTKALDSLSDDDSDEKSSAKDPPKKAAPKKQAPKKQASIKTMFSNISDGDQEVKSSAKDPPKKTAPKKQAPKKENTSKPKITKKKAPKVVLSSDEEDDFAPKKSKNAPKKNKSDSESEDDLEMETLPQPKTDRGGRGKPAVSYNFSESDNDSASD